MDMLSERMHSHADPSQVEGLARFFKTGPGQYGYGDKFLGIKVPVTREVVRSCWRDVSFEDLEQCIRSEYHEIRLAALLALVEIFKHAPKRSFVANAPQDDNFHSEHPCHSERSEESLRSRCIDFYLAHTEFINNWDLVDLSCYPLLGEWLLDADDRSLLYSLARDGRTIWEQRIGIVSSMTFIRHGQLDDTFAIADILLHHPHDLIHKAVGWLLREAGKRDKAALENYLRSFVPIAPQDDNCHSERSEESMPRYKVMPRTMLRYAIEKFPEAERQHYLAK